MWDKNPLFLDYLQIRRRIESRLAGSQAVLAHIALFLIAVIALLITTTLTGYPTYPYVPRSHFVDANASYLMTVWSIVLLGHGAWVYWKSGASANTRTQRIEQELSQRLESDDTELVGTPRQVFRLQALLDEDIRLRAGLFAPIIAFLMVNAATWAAWAVQGAYTSYTWQMTVPTALVFLLPPLAVNALRRGRRSRRIKRMLANGELDAAPRKRKRAPDIEDDAAARLSDDGELIVISDDDERAALRGV